MGIYSRTHNCLLGKDKRQLCRWFSCPFVSIMVQKLPKMRYLTCNIDSCNFVDYILQQGFGQSLYRFIFLF